MERRKTQPSSQGALLPRDGSERNSGNEVAEDLMYIKNQYFYRPPKTFIHIDFFLANPKEYHGPEAQLSKKIRLRYSFSVNGA